MDDIDHVVAVIGGGPAGMMAAATAGARCQQVDLLEKNVRLGKKLRITGKGRCNVTNSADVDTMLSQVMKNKEFLYSAFYTFDNHSLMRFLEERGVRLKVERGGRVFPVSDHAHDVVNAFIRSVEAAGVRVLCQSPVQAICTHAQRVTGVVLANGTIMPADSVILATGGKAYPATGSTGDGYRLAGDLGHTIITPTPALTPLEVRQSWVERVQGLTLKNIGLRLYRGGCLSFEGLGEMLFTHYGVSGPLVLTASAFVDEPGREEYRVELDLKPGLDEEKLDARVQRDFQQYTRKFFTNSLGDLLPKKLIPVVVELSGIAPDKPVHQITRQERWQLLGVLKGLTLTVTRLRGFSEALITRGGVDVGEVNPSTMESRKIRGLFFAGEILDVHAHTGGYNLQIAFSTGYLAGLNA